PTPPLPPTKSKTTPLNALCTTCRSPLGQVLVHHWSRTADVLQKCGARMWCFECAAQGGCTNPVGEDEKGPFLENSEKRAMMGESVKASETAEKKRGKRHRILLAPQIHPETNQGLVECLTCKARFAVGCVWVEEFPRLHDGSGVFESNTESPNDWEECLKRAGKWGDVGVEMLCEGCEAQFAFCTECGGGGRFRTGKWRPKELFSPQRRTCSLSHVRLGNVSSHSITVWNFKEDELRSQLVVLMEECKEVYFDCLWGVVGVPEVIATSPPPSTFPALQAYLQQRQLLTTSLILSITNPSEPLVLPDVLHASTSFHAQNLYLAVVKVQDGHTRKAKPSNVTSNTNPSSTNSTSSAPPTKSRTTPPARASSSFTSNRGSAAKKKGHLLGGYALAIYHPETQNVTLLDLILRVPGSRGGGLERKLVQSLLERIGEDVMARRRVEVGSNGGTSRAGLVGNVIGTGGSGLGLMQAVMECWLQRWRIQMHKLGMSDDPSVAARPLQETEHFRSTYVHQRQQHQQLHSQEQPPYHVQASTSPHVSSSTSRSSNVSAVTAETADQSPTASRALEHEVNMLLNERKNSVYMSVKADELLSNRKPLKRS
ncbi:hypothetical protein HDV05_003502, partial [Chytridiales sp. JEL 0842]